MSQIRLYVDEDAAAFALVEALRHRGVDVVTVLDAGMASATDEQQLVIATSQGRAIYSHNVGDFCRLHREFLVQSRQHAGIILISRQRISIGEKLRRLLRLIATITAEDMSGRLEFP